MTRDQRDSQTLSRPEFAQAEPEASGLYVKSFGVSTEMEQDHMVLAAPLWPLSAFSYEKV